MSRQVVAILVGLLVAFAISFGLNVALTSAGAEPLASAWVIGLAVSGVVTMAIANTGGNRKVAFGDANARKAALSGDQPPGTARVILFRDGMMGSRLNIDVSVNDKDAGQLKGRQFTAAIVPPGRHRVRAALGGALNKGSKPAETEIELAGGETALLRITLAMKMTTSDVVMTRVDDPSTAMPKLSRMTLVLAVG